MATRRISPTVRRRRLAKILGDRRAELGKARNDAAEYVGVGAVTITRMESPTAGKPKLADVERYARYLEFNDAQVAELVQLARDCRTKGWWQQLGGAFDNAYLTFIGMEEEADTVQQFSISAVPGLLQTSDYQRALIAADMKSSPEEQVEELVVARQVRQKRLEGDDALTGWFIIGEAALRCRVGGEKVMREQLERLLALSHNDNVELQVLSFDKGAHPAIATGSFTILGFPDQQDPQVVYRELITGLFIEDAAEVKGHGRLFDRLKAQALGPDESRELVTRLLAEL